MTIQLYPGDCREILLQLPENSIDSCVTDPPYGLNFMGKAWDTGAVAFNVETWRAVYRVLKPGGHLLAFGGTRTSHRMVCAIEDAGFEIRDTVMWLYGTGFPKSHDVSKGIDKAAGAKGAFGAPKSAAHAGWIQRGRMRGNDNEEGWQRPWMEDPDAVGNAARQYIPATPEAAQWEGWGTALKPAWEPIIVARKPLIGTVAKNVLEYGVGGINIDGCRVESKDNLNGGAYSDTERKNPFFKQLDSNAGVFVPPAGRWPANVIHDGSDEVVNTFPIAPGQQGKVKGTEPSAVHANTYSPRARLESLPPREDSGTAARFFYSAKATKADRNGSKHPTVKPISLMQYLCRLVTPPNGVVLDPFAGSGTTGQAARLEGFSAILIEKEEEYVADIRRRFDA